MIYLIFLVLFFIVYHDARLLRNKNADAYARILRLAPFPWAALSLAFVIFVLPIYLRRRFEFKKFIKTRIPENPDPNFPVPAMAAEPSREDLASDALGIAIIWFTVTILMEVLLKVVSMYVPIFRAQLLEIIFVSLFSYLVIIFLIYRVTEIDTRAGFKRSVALRPGRFPVWMMASVSVLTGGLLAYLGASILLGREVQPTTPISEVIHSTRSFSLIFIFVALAILVAPFCEEIVFRGYFFHVIKKYKGQTVAVILISLSFALMHVAQYWGDWGGIALVAVAGLTFTLLRVWTRTTTASIVAHYSYNLGIVIFPVLMMFYSNAPYFQYMTRYSQLTSVKKEELLLKSMENQPQLSEAYNDLAWLYAEEDRNLEEALNLIDEALLMVPDRAAYLDTKAEILYKLKRYQEAVELGEAVLEQDPQNAYYINQLKKFRQALN
jgi:membrane protease YdiL (CAAX protease family)